MSVWFYRIHSEVISRVIRHLKFEVSHPNGSLKPLNKDRRMALEALLVLA